MIKDIIKHLMVIRDEQERKAVTGVGYLNMCGSFENYSMSIKYVPGSVEHYGHVV